MRVALILWDGRVGGAEIFTGELARGLRALGLTPTVVFVGTGAPLSRRLDEEGIPNVQLGLPRGRAVLRSARRFAAVVDGVAPSAALLVSAGFMAGALRGGGYRGAIAAVEHGALLQIDQLPLWAQGKRRLDRRSGIWACDAEVGVSRFMRDAILRRAHPRRVEWIWNGVDTERFSPRERAPGSGIIVGCAARLRSGKGVDDLLAAFSRLGDPAVQLVIAGDGPERRRLEQMAHELGIAPRVGFRGIVSDMPSFWRACDIAAVPSNQWVESFGMVAVEAMSTGLAVVATRNGGLEEVVAEGETGVLVDPGDRMGLAKALEGYAGNAGLRAEHGARGRTRAVSLFSLTACASSYAELLTALVPRRGTAA